MVIFHSYVKLPLLRTQDSSRGFGNWYRSYSADRSMESSIKRKATGPWVVCEPASNWVRTSCTPNYNLYIIIYYIRTWLHIYIYSQWLSYIYIDSLTSCSTQLPGPVLSTSFLFVELCEVSNNISYWVLLGRSLSSNRIFPWKMVIFHSYVSLPKGTIIQSLPSWGT